MTNEPLFLLNTTLQNLARAASELGWQVNATYAEFQPDHFSVALRFWPSIERPDLRRCYGAWTNLPAEGGKRSTKFYNAGCQDALIPLPTVKALTTYLGIPPKPKKGAKDEGDTGAVTGSTSA